MNACETSCRFSLFYDCISQWVLSAWPNYSLCKASSLLGDWFWFGSCMWALVNARIRPWPSRKRQNQHSTFLMNVITMHIEFVGGGRASRNVGRVTSFFKVNWHVCGEHVIYHCVIYFLSGKRFQFISCTNSKEALAIFNAFVRHIMRGNTNKNKHNRINGIKKSLIKRRASKFCIYNYIFCGARMSEAA